MCVVCASTGLLSGHLLSVLASSSLSPHFIPDHADTRDGRWQSLLITCLITVSENESITLTTAYRQLLCRPSSTVFDEATLL